ncbi:hypothetical protein [Asticcacaulis sp. 201]|uniref:hypothetical protein n=1 Tax=Asticcacaulis sp. 201 TaxID=3028787 RepID=UPI002916BC78|nr:hypothetical protein [Asticcacaulis sp. 201]MDV6330112.1 hypothetical protein [Asticcacaulis sp. 201]
MVLWFSEPDFDGTFHDAPQDPYYSELDVSYIDPVYIYIGIGLFVAIVVAALIGAYIGRNNAQQRLDLAKKRSVDAIYDSIRHKLDLALKSRGLQIIERAAQVQEEVHNRLGHVIALVDKPGKTVTALEKALPAPQAPKPPEAKPAKVKVPMSAEEQMIAVWEALNRFRVFWADEAHVKGMIRAAQEELARADSALYVRQLETQYMPGPQGKPWMLPSPFGKKTGPAAVVAAALNDADKAGSAPLPAAAEPAPQPEPAPSPDAVTPPPPPPPPPAPKPGRKKLPAHKRNMLA